MAVLSPRLQPLWGRMATDFESIGKGFASPGLVFTSPGVVLSSPWLVFSTRRLVRYSQQVVSGNRIICKAGRGWEGVSPWSVKQYKFLMAVPTLHMLWFISHARVYTQWYPQKSIHPFTWYIETTENQQFPVWILCISSLHTPPQAFTHGKSCEGRWI